VAGPVLIVAPGAAPDDRACAHLQRVAQAAVVATELLRPGTENALRQRLAAGGVAAVFFVGRGLMRAAGHATLDFESSAGAAPRDVNLGHLARILAAAPALQGMVLMHRDDPRRFDGFARALVREGAPAALVFPGSAEGLVATVSQCSTELRRWFDGWTGAVGSDWMALARQVSASAEAAAATGATAQRPQSAAPAPLPQGVPPVAPEASDAQASRSQPIERELADKRAAGQFDVFLCHNSADKPAVRAVARQLRARGILPWLDEWELPPGQPWQPLLERQIERIRSAAVFVGRAGVGPWQEQELYGFLREFVARKAPVIPVLLPDAPSAPELPVFLRAMTYVDFRQAEPEPMARLEWGITGVRPAYD
jgi:hypothetical protein